MTSADRLSGVRDLPGALGECVARSTYSRDKPVAGLHDEVAPVVIPHQQAGGLRIERASRFIYHELNQRIALQFGVDARRGHLEAFHLLAPLAFQLIQSRVFDDDGQLHPGRCQDALVVGGKSVRAGALCVNHADHLLARNQRHGHFGLDAGDAGDVTRVGVHIAHAHAAARWRAAFPTMPWPSLMRTLREESPSVPE